jgi:hypothetical protein
MSGTERKSTMNFRTLALLTLVSSIVLPYAASQTAAPTLAASALTAVPPLIPYSGQVEGRTGRASASFLIYKDQQGANLSSSNRKSSALTRLDIIRSSSARPIRTVFHPISSRPARPAGLKCRSPEKPHSHAFFSPAFPMHSKQPTRRPSAAFPHRPLSWPDPGLLLSSEQSQQPLPRTLLPTSRLPVENPAICRCSLAQPASPIQSFSKTVWASASATFLTAPSTSTANPSSADPFRSPESGTPRPHRESIPTPSRSSPRPIARRKRRMSGHSSLCKPNRPGTTPPHPAPL